MVMAAGVGVRLLPFTSIEPKPLLPVLGIPILQFVLDCLWEAGVKKVVLNFHHLPTRFKKGLENLDFFGMEKILSDESQLLLGSAGGIRKALPHFQSQPFYLLNADNIYSVDLSAMAEHHFRLRESHKIAMTLALTHPAHSRSPTPLPLPVRRQLTQKYRKIVFEPQSGLVTGLDDLETSTTYYSGVAVVEPQLFEKLPLEKPTEFVESILAPAVRERKVGFKLGKGLWYDIGNPQLWLKCHLDFIYALERGTLEKKWRERIERPNKRIGDQIWTSRNRKILNSSHWIGPSYWNPDGDETALPPRDFGPNCVLYGTSAHYQSISNGIGFGSLWQG